MSTYLVTGGAGFIGSKIISKLLSLGNSIVTIDNLSTGNIENIPSDVHFIKGNCHDALIIKKLTSYKFDAIFHIAGQSSGEISFEDPVYDLQTNAQSTLLLLDFALKNGCKKFIYASTMSIYGTQGVEKAEENFIPNPISFYGVGKIASENYMKIYQSYGISCIALRLFNVYGPGQNLNNLKQGMISIYLAMALKNNKIQVKGSGNRFRDFVYIDDVVNSFVSCIDYENKYFQAINISTGIKNTVDQVISTIKKYWPENIEITFLEGTPGDQFGIIGDNTKAKHELKWQPEVNIENGIHTMVQWVLKNEINKIK